MAQTREISASEWATVWIILAAFIGYMGILIASDFETMEAENEAELVEQGMTLGEACIADAETKDEWADCLNICTNPDPIWSEACKTGIREGVING